MVIEQKHIRNNFAVWIMLYILALKKILDNGSFIDVRFTEYQVSACYEIIRM